MFTVGLFRIFNILMCVFHHPKIVTLSIPFIWVIMLMGCFFGHSFGNTGLESRKKKVVRYKIYMISNIINNIKIGNNINKYIICILLNINKIFQNGSSKTFDQIIYDKCVKEPKSQIAITLSCSSCWAAQ